MSYIIVNEEIFFKRLSSPSKDSICIIDNCKEFIGMNLYDSFFSTFLIFDSKVSAYIIKDNVFYICPGTLKKNFSQFNNI